MVDERQDPFPVEADHKVVADQKSRHAGHAAADQLLPRRRICVHVFFDVVDLLFRKKLLGLGAIGSGLGRKQDHVFHGLPPFVRVGLPFRKL